MNSKMPNENHARLPASPFPTYSDRPGALGTLTEVHALGDLERRVTGLASSTRRGQLLSPGARKHEPRSFCTIVFFFRTQTGVPSLRRAMAAWFHAGATVGAYPFGTPTLHW